MTGLAPVIEAYWDGAFSGAPLRSDDPGLILTVDPALDQVRRCMLLDRGDGTVRVTMTPALADAAGLRTEPPASAAVLEGRLAAIGVDLHDADRLFYVPAGSGPAGDAPPCRVRRLGDDDRAAFAAFQASAPPHERDEAFVELDHMMAVGGFVGDRLVAAASLYPWDRSRLADLGVMTRPDARNQGHARHVVRAICLLARRDGFEPQYRCRVDNRASMAAALAAGLRPFGDWRVAVSDDD